MFAERSTALVDSFSQWDDAPHPTLFTVYCHFKGKVRILLGFFFVCFIIICYSTHLNTVLKRKKVFKFQFLCISRLESRPLALETVERQTFFKNQIKSNQMVHVWSALPHFTVWSELFQPLFTVKEQYGVHLRLIILLSQLNSKKTF